MPLLPSLPDPAHLADLLRRYPMNVESTMALTDGVMRNEGVLSIAERELIAAYVSGLNACRFCMDSHRIYAEVFGVEIGLLEAMLNDIETAPVSSKLRPLFAYVAKLNRLPSKLTKADAQAVFEAGWPEAALYEAIQICALFNMMNRLVEGSGVNFDYEKNPAGHSTAKNGFDKATHRYQSFGQAIIAQGNN